MALEVFHTVNSGLYFRSGEHTAFFDGLHTGSAFGMSDTPGEVLERAKRENGFFGGRNLLLFTHLHDDHYDDEKLEQFLRFQPESAIFSPESSRNIQAQRLENEHSLLSHGPFTIHAFDTAHQGGAALQAAHMCYLLQTQGKSFLICGDARLTEELVLRIKALAGDIDAVFVNVYHLNTEKERRLIRLLEPGQCCIYHLPASEDDVKAYRETARAALDFEGLGSVKMLSPMKGFAWP